MDPGPFFYIYITIYFLKHSRGEEKGKPDVDVLPHGLRKPSPPKDSVVTASFPDARERRRQPVEDNVVPVLPQMPETKPAEGGGGTRRNGGRQRATGGVAKLESGHRRDAKTEPKRAGKAASKQEVADCLKRTAAERAEAVRGGKDLLFEKIGTDLKRFDDISVRI
jgi:hypothetical protein